MMTLPLICIVSTAFIAIVVGLIYELNNTNINRSNKEDTWYLIFVTFVMGAFGFLIGIVIYGLICLNIPPDIKTVYNYENIELLKDNSQVEGSFRSGLFFASGIIGEEMYYVMYIKTHNGFTLKKIKCSEATVVYTKTTPRIVTKGMTYKNTEHNRFFDYDRFFDDSHWIQYKIKYIIEVPVGTITNNYTLDGE